MSPTLLLSYFDARATVHCLRDSFREYHDTFDDLITNVLGFGHYEYSELDQGLGDRVIKLSEIVQTYNDSLKETNSLIYIAGEITREPKLEERLSNLIGNASFANELFELICKLSFPKRAYGTLVYAARTTRTFENVTFRNKSSSSPENTCPTQASPLSPSTASSAPSTASAPDPSTPLTPLTPPTPSVVPFPVQRNGAHQEVALLIGSLLCSQLLPKHESAWYSFGFVCTRNEEEEGLLADAYNVLLQGANSVQAFFHELHQALEMHSLALLFLVKGYGSFREDFPQVEAFLSTPPDQRPTVWRLEQFIQDPDTTEPPACLRRDYGFKMCRQREDVMRLKAIYVKILENMKPEDLHTACLHGRLLEAAMREGIVLDEKDRRLMHNDYPSPFVGFDNDAGLKAYRLPLFRKQEKLQR